MDLSRTRIIIPAINNAGDVRGFEIQCLVKNSMASEIIITGMVDETIVDTVQVFSSILEYDMLKIGEKIERKKIHFHFTDGSFIKEGTSVGLGIVLAYFVATGKLIGWKNCSILASGEIDVYGNIYEVGGIEEKLRGVRYDWAIIPQGNYKKIYGKNVLGISHLKEIIK